LPSSGNQADLSQASERIGVTPAQVTQVTWAGSKVIRRRALVGLRPVDLPGREVRLGVLLHRSHCEVDRLAVGERHLDRVAGSQAAEIVEDPGRLVGVDVADDDGRPCQPLGGPAGHGAGLVLRSSQSCCDRGELVKCVFASESLHAELGDPSARIADSAN